MTDDVRAAQAGDEGAFTRLVRGYQDMAFAYAASILRDYDQAADAAQEAFIEAWRTLAALREPAAFPAWLRMIVFKHCDRITRRKRHPTAALETAVHVASPGRSPEEALAARDIARTLRGAIAALPSREREIVLLYYVGDRSHAEIGAFLGVTPNAVKTRLYAARRKLRTHMSDVEEGLGGVRPSRDSRFVDKVRRMIRPEALKKSTPLFWSPGMGADVWEMFRAAITGDVATLGRLLDQDPSLARCHFEYRTPLGFAVRENQVAAAAFLLDRGVVPDLEDPLEIARDRGYEAMERMLVAKLAEIADIDPAGDRIAASIRNGDIEEVRRLLDESPATIDAADARGNKPIHWAVMTRRLGMIDELLGRGADIDARRRDGALPIQLTNGDYHYRGWRDVSDSITTTPRQVLEHLRSRGAHVDICTASWIGDIARVRDLLAQDPSLANRPSDYVTYYACSGTPLRNAAGAGHIDIVRLLLDHGADPNLPEEHIAPRGHALHAAVCNGHHEIVELLLERGAHSNVEIESSADTLSAALARGDQRMVDLLCSWGATRPVHLLAHYDDVRTAAAVFAVDPTLADDAEAFGSASSEAFVRLLLRYRPDLPKRFTVVKSPQLTRRLFRHGMDPNRPNWLRITPLHSIAGSGDVEIAAVFLEHGAELDAIDEEHCSTPLGWAARRGHLRMVEFLLRRGADPGLPSDQEWARPLAWARRRGHEGIARLLDEFLRTGALPQRSLARYESQVRDLLGAYGGADEHALRRTAEHFGVERMLTWDRPAHAERTRRLRQGVQRRLGRHPKDEDLPGELDTMDARLLIARSHGFDDWDSLIREVEPTAK